MAIDIDLQQLKSGLEQIGVSEASRRTGISRTTIHAFIDGSKTNLRMATLVKLAMACGMRLSVTGA